MTVLLLLLLAPLELAVEGYRPLAQALEELERRHGWNVSYEEGLLKEPVRGRLRFTYNPADGPEVVLEGLVAAAKAQGHAGRFEVLRLEGMEKWSVVMREFDGLMVQAALDVTVDLKGEHQGLGQAAKQLEEQLSAAMGFSVTVGSGVDAKLWLLNRTRVGARGEPARLVLERMLRTYEPGESAGTAKSEMVWHVYCDSSFRRMCVVNTRPRHGAEVMYPFGLKPPPPPLPPPPR